MLEKMLQGRQNVTGSIFLLYLLPFFLLTLYSMDLLSPERSWKTLSAGLLLSALGTFSLFHLLESWESQIRQRAKIYAEAEAVGSAPPIDEQDFSEMETSLSELQSKYSDALAELGEITEELSKEQAERDKILHEKLDLMDEFAAYKSEHQEEIEQKKVLINEYQETIREQREVIEKKNEQITELDSKVSDLNYEVKTLLNLAKSPEGLDLEVEPAEEPSPAPPEQPQLPITHSKQIRSPEDASLQLKRCIDIAQKITGANHFSQGTPRFRDFHTDNFTLDLRRLFDTLRSESLFPVLVFSPKENKMLFVNNQIKNLIGWTPDRFTQDFFEVVEEGMDDWRHAVGSSSSHAEHRMRLVLRSQRGESVLVHCHLKAIPTGIFRGHIIAVLYAA